MQSIKIIVSIFLMLTPHAHGFFWVPNRYSTPFWSGDTRITTPSISSWDGYLGRSYNNNAAIDCTSIDAGLCAYQTVTAGFFAELSMPITSMHLRTDTINRAGDLGYSNCSLLIGWGINYDLVPIFDFIDLMIRTGALTPAHKLLADPTLFLYGYPFWGIPCTLDLAAGLCEWMTFGFHASGSFFPNHSTVWHLQPYFKADHCMYGLSAWFGYSYTGSSHEQAMPSLFEVNSCQWSLHTLHYGLEYECIQAEYPLHPRIGCYFNQPVGGENSLKRSNFGITAGIDITW